MKHAFNTMSTNGEDKYITPPWVYEDLGIFDLDPCCPVRGNPNIAKQSRTKLNWSGQGLKAEWEGRVWLNPPYGRETKLWIEKLSVHGDGIALIFARTCTTWFHEFIFNKATGIFFFAGRLTFLNTEGELYPANSGAPSVLIAYGENNYQAIENSNLKGKLVRLEPTTGGVND